MKQKLFKTLFSLGVLVFGLLMFGAVARAGWEMEIVDDSAVGNYAVATGYDNAMAVDSAENPHIFYHVSNVTTGYGALKYATKVAGNWQTETVIESNTDWSIGRYMSATVDSNNIPQVVYWYTINSGSGYIQYLIYAKKTDSGWQTEEISDDIQWTDGSRSMISFKIDSSGRLYVVYPTAVSWIYAYRTNGGAWQKEEIVSLLTSNSPYGTPSLSLDSNNKPHIVVSKIVEDKLNLYYVYQNNDETWSVETIETLSNYPQDEIKAPSLILDTTGNPHVSYYGTASKNLKYAMRIGANNWQLEDITKIIGDKEYTGIKTSIGLDKNGNPHIAYLDQTDWYLKYASKIGNTWQIETISSYYFGGRYAQMVFDNSDNPHISYTGGTDQSGDYIMQYAHYIPEETFVTKTETAGTGQASNSEKLIQKANEYLTKNFVFSFLKLPKKLQAKKYYIKTNKYAKYPAKYANAKKKTLKKYWKVTTNLKNYKAGKAKNKYSLRLMFAYDQSEFAALQKQNKKLKEKQLKLKYYNTTTKKWTKVPKVKQNTTRNFFYVTLKNYKYPLNTKFAIGK